MSATALKSNSETFNHTSYIPLQNAQVAANTYFGLATGMEAIIPSADGISNDASWDPGVIVQPYLKISVQPCDKFRFRYKSESGSHGKLRGPAKNRSKINFPTVQFHNWPALHNKIEIRASLYTFEEDPKPHILELVGKNCKNGACYEKLSEDNTAIFRFLEIESKRKEEAINILMQKEKDLCGNICDEEEIRKLVIEDMKQLNMNCAVLCFEALHDNISVCPKVFSGPIKNLKSTSSDLKITRISSSSGSCRGGEDIILLCDKINKDDIEIHFYEKDENDKILFKENGIFNPKVDVHHQVAIAFKTPPYRDNVGATVQMELYRRSDKQSSEPRTFTFIPDDIDTLRHSKKRKFNPAESVELQNQASCSSEFMSSPSNSSDLEANTVFLGSPGTSSIEDDMIDQLISEEDLDQFLSHNGLVDFNNFNQLLECENIYDPPTTEEIPAMQMDAASFGVDPFNTQDDEVNYWDKYYDDEPFGPDAIAPQSLAVRYSTMSTKNTNPGTVTQTSSGGSILAAIADLAGFSGNKDIVGATSVEVLAYYAREGSYSLWNATVGRAVSYMRPSPSSDRKTPSHNFIAQGQMANPARKASQYADNKINTKSALTHKVDAQSEMADPSRKSPHDAHEQIYAQSGLIFSMDDLSIQDDNKRDVKEFVSLPITNRKSPVKVLDKTVVTDANSGDIRDTRNREDTNKASEMNKNFDSVKKGVSEIMKKRRKDVYLNYISRLMSVKDENENLFIHLAVMEQSENLNLMARILKISPHIVNETNKFQETPLHLATQKNAWKMAFLLLAQDGNPSIVDVNGNNCFHIASQSNYAKSMKILLLPSLKKGKRIPSIDGFNYDGFSPLHLSVMNNAKECMQLLLKAGADININDRTSGSSPLHLAIKQQPSLASDLLSHPDIDLSNADFNGYSILHALCVMKGTPMPIIDKFTDCVDWARKTLALPSKDFDNSSDTDSSGNSDSDEEVTNQHETEALPSNSYFANVLPQEINGVEENLNSSSEVCEKRLCEFLDANGGWRKLGIFVGLDDKTLNGVSKLCKHSSPSKLVMRTVKKLYHKCDKMTLINILTAADLKNAAKILKNERF